MTQKYLGQELELFSQAHNWKHYFCSQIEPLLAGRILEVGAGIGGVHEVLQRVARNPNLRWTCLEPDAELAREIENRRSRGALRQDTEIRVGTLDSLDDLFDTVLYIDVLEHIEDDRKEIAKVAKVLAPGGHLIILCPAHNFLYSPFDRAIGHFRRYDKRSLRQAISAGFKEEKLCYLDSVGMLASLANRALLRQSYPTLRQVLLWDRVMVPLSRILDRILRMSFGKSILGVWRRTEPL